MKKLIGVALLLATSAAASAAVTHVDHGIIVDHVAVIDTATGRSIAGRAVVVADGRIVAIVPSGSVTGSGSARYVEGRGRFVVPGYLDMHAHPLDSVGERDDLDLMLANGITGFRQMSGAAATLARRKAGPLTSVDQPTLLAMPGEILTRANAATPAAAIAEVDRQKEAGADFIKVIDVSPPTFNAVMDEATRLKLSVAGHLPTNVDVRDASARGMRSIEHLGPQDTLLLSCSRDEAALRAAVAATASNRPTLGGPTPPGVIARILANPMAFTDAASLARIGRVVASFDAGKCRSVAAELKAHQTWQVPTLIRLRTMEFGDDPAYVSDSNLRYVAPATRALWNSVAQQFTARMSPEARTTLVALFALQLRLVKLLDDAGVPLLAGSDLGGSWDIAGFDLHQEFDLLATAGLTPLRVLQMTTRDGAAFLGRDDLGSVAVGKTGDLVVLDGNPVENVANLHRVFAVIHNGKVHDRADLDAIEARVSAANP